MQLSLLSESVVSDPEDSFLSVANAVCEACQFTRTRIVTYVSQSSASYYVNSIFAERLTLQLLD
jgi:hypothetical protein